MTPGPAHTGVIRHLLHTCTCTRTCVPTCTWGEPGRAHLHLSVHRCAHLHSRACWRLCAHVSTRATRACPPQSCAHLHSPPLTCAHLHSPVLSYAHLHSPVLSRAHPQPRAPCGSSTTTPSVPLAGGGASQRGCPIGKGACWRQPMDSGGGVLAPPLGRGPQSRGAGVAGERERGRGGPGGSGGAQVGPGGAGSTWGPPCPPPAFPRWAPPLFAVFPRFFLENFGDARDVWGAASPEFGGRGGRRGRSSFGPRPSSVPDGKSQILPIYPQFRESGSDWGSHRPRFVSLPGPLLNPRPAPLPPWRTIRSCNKIPKTPLAPPRPP